MKHSLFKKLIFGKETKKTVYIHIYIAFKLIIIRKTGNSNNKNGSNTDVFCLFVHWGLTIFTIYTLILSFIFVFVLLGGGIDACIHVCFSEQLNPKAINAHAQYFLYMHCELSAYKVEKEHQCIVLLCCTSLLCKHTDHTEVRLLCV